MSIMVKVKVIFDYEATQPDELTIKVGDIINDVKQQPGGWWEGVYNGKRGVFPDNFVEVYNPPVNEPVKGPKPGGGKVSALKGQLGDLNLGPPPPGLGKGAAGKPKQMAVVLFEYRPEQPDELELMEGDEVQIVGMKEEGWWEGVLRGKTGMFPSNFVKLLDTAPVVPSNPFNPASVNKPNDLVGSRGSGGRPPVEKPKMLPPTVTNEPSNAPPPQLPKRNRGVKARVIYSYHAQNDDELSLTEGQTVLVTDQKLEDPGWWRGELSGKSGVFPDNFVEIVPEEESPLPPVMSGPQRFGEQPQPQQTRGPAPRGPSVRVAKPPPQPPQEPEQPARLPPRPGGLMKQETDGGRGVPMPTPDGGRGMPLPTPMAIKHEQETKLALPMVNGAVDDKALSALREDMDKLRESMVSRESFELLQRELKASKEALDNYKKDTNKKLIDLMKEIDGARIQSTQNNVELARIRRLAEDHWMSN